jgi:hypothetical protein
MYTHADSNTHSAKEVTSDGLDGLEVVQPGLERVGFSSQSYQQQPASFNHPEDKTHIFAPVLPQETICGLRKVTFWLSLAITIVAIIMVGVAVGLGMGMSQAKKSNCKILQFRINIKISHADFCTDSQDASMTTSAPTTTSSPTTTTATQLVFQSSTNSSRASPSTTTLSSPCPANNGTTYSEGNRKFRILCDSDFTGKGKETLASTIMSSFYDCLGLCNSMNNLQSRSDVGCTYNREGTGSQSPGTCWCLGGEKTTTSNEGNDAAVPL